MNTWGPMVALEGVRVSYGRVNPVTLNAGATSHRRCPTPMVALGGWGVSYGRGNPTTLNAGATCHWRCHLAHEKTPSRRTLQYEHLGSFGGPREGECFL